MQMECSLLRRVFHVFNFPVKDHKTPLSQKFQSDKNCEVNFLKCLRRETSQAMCVIGFPLSPSTFPLYNNSLFLLFPFSTWMCDDRWHNVVVRSTQLTFLFFLPFNSGTRCWIMMRPKSLSTALFNVPVDIHRLIPMLGTHNLRWRW